MYENDLERFLYVKFFNNRFYNDTCFELIENLDPKFCQPMATIQGCNKT